MQKGTMYQSLEMYFIKRIIEFGIYKENITAQGLKCTDD